MAGKKKFEPEKITAALKLLRTLPVKDNRKTTGETLHMLKGGILDALDKGYDRMEIRKTIAAADVVISSTTFNDFLAGNIDATPENGKESPSKRKTVKEKTVTEPEQTDKDASMKPGTPLAAERKPVTPETENLESGKRESPTLETRETTPARKAEPERMPSYYTPDLPDSEL